MGRIIRAFFHSLAGFGHGIRHEMAVRQEIIVFLIALPACLFVTQDWWKRLALVGVLLIVLAVELLNSAIEALCDHVTPEIHPHIKIAKDYGSAAVFASLTLAGLTWLVALAERLL